MLAFRWPDWFDAAGLDGAEAWYEGPPLEPGGPPRLAVRRVTAHRWFYVGFAAGAHFLVDPSGARVFAWTTAGLPHEDVCTYLVGPVMGLVLHLRGRVPLHASGVEVAGRAVLFLGPVGSGKSTTAAELARRGVPVLADDVVALREGEDGIVADPAYPRLRLWPSSSALLFGRPDALPRIVPDDPEWDKCFLDLTGEGMRHVSGPLPLGAVYLLGARGEGPVSIEPVPPRERLISLVTHTYVQHLTDVRMQAAALAVLSRVAAEVPIRRLSPSADPADLPRLGDAVLAECGARREPSAA